MAILTASYDVFSIFLVVRTIAHLLNSWRFCISDTFNNSSRYFELFLWQLSSVQTLALDSKIVLVVSVTVCKRESVTGICNCTQSIISLKKLRQCNRGHFEILRKAVVIFSKRHFNISFSIKYKLCDVYEIICYVPSKLMNLFLTNVIVFSWPFDLTQLVLVIPIYLLTRNFFSEPICCISFLFHRHINYV